MQVIDGAVFDPATSGLKAATRHGVDTASEWVRIEGMDKILFGR